MKHGTLTIVALLIFSAILRAQDGPASIKLVEFDRKTETIDGFVDKTKILIERLSSDKDASGFINITKKDPLFGKLTKVLEQYRDVASRLSFVDRSIIYQSNTSNIEFWYTPAGAEKPFTIGCGLCICPTISVDGKQLLDEPLTSETKLVFTANVAGGSQDEPIKYHWTVDGGQIISGQGTPSIEVKLTLPFKDVTATVNLSGIDPACSCPTSASETTKLTDN
jgi:hypothetical protein